MQAKMFSNRRMRESDMSPPHGMVPWPGALGANSTVENGTYEVNDID